MVSEVGQCTSVALGHAASETRALDAAAQAVGIAQGATDYAVGHALASASPVRAARSPSCRAIQFKLA